MDELDVLILELDEAVKRGANKAKAERMVRPLELAMRKGFRLQGSLFVRKLRTLKAKFSESTSNDPWEAHALLLEAAFKEAVTPADWQKAWYEVEQATLKLFSAPIEKAVKKALEIGALAQIADLGLGIKWDLKNPSALGYLDNYGAAMVTNINETTRDILQTLISQAAEEGWSYQRTAEAITERFEQFAVGKPQEHIDSRAHLVAVTEIGNAYTEGNLIVARDLAEAGIGVEKAWDTVGDGKVSEGCLENQDAGWIDVNDVFPSGHQRPLRFPGCRCDLLTRIKQ
ncbi:MAG: hypothetical protein CVU44_21005 [Chloroflexi bacterium HGW-Chloroflexi-6]|nr:MAG: hypothetical protein CVU44_21005 [Chloroflexi bacterium HGW-Chloroflexi-6]